VSWQIKKKKKEEKGKTNSNKNNVQTKKEINAKKKSCLCCFNQCFRSG